MDIGQVVGTLVCTFRVPGLDYCSLRIIKDAKGKLVVATDPVGCRPGNWVFTVSGSAARWAMPNPQVLTDLTIGGIIDDWEAPARASAEPDKVAVSGAANDERARAA